MSVCIALILSGGAGQRFGDTTPKQYLPLVDRAVIRHAVDTFLKHPRIDHIRIVRRPQDQTFYDKLFDDLEILEPVDAGETRQESARLGLESLKGLNPDTVLMQEDCQVEGTSVVIPKGIERGANRRFAGEDIRVNDTIITKGQRLRPQEIGLAASIGKITLSVYRPLRVALFSTGDEICDLGSKLKPGTIFDSNRYSISALLHLMRFIRMNPGFRIFGFI